MFGIDGSEINAAAAEIRVLASEAVEALDPEAIRRLIVTANQIVVSLDALLQEVRCGGLVITIKPGGSNV